MNSIFNKLSIRVMAITLISACSIASFAQAPSPSSSAYSGWKQANTTPGTPHPFSTNSINNAPTGTAPGCYIVDDVSYTNFPGNDDSSTGNIALPFTFTLYGTNYTSCWINNNGNITFSGALSTFTSAGFPFTGTPMVAPFWADVDTRIGNTVKYKVETHRLIVTWPGVGYYNQQTNLLNTFQCIISDGTAAGGLGVGNNVAFYYGDMQWAEGQFSGGVNGFGSNPATAGINQGNGTDYVQIGRFGVNSSAYDGGGGNPDGINYIDYECFTFNATGNTINNNLPPSVSGAPAGDTIIIHAGTTGVLNLSFLPPEVGQQVSTIINTGGLCNTTINTNTSGATSNTMVSIVGDACNMGVHHIIFTATDDYSTPASTVVDITVIVTPGANVPTISQWGLFILCLISLSIGMIYMFKKEHALAFTGGEMISAGRSSLFNKSLFGKLFSITSGLAIIGLGLAFAYFGSITLTDTIGSMISAAIIAFIAQVVILLRKNEQ